MAVRAIDGFDFYATTAQVLQRAGFLQWNSTQSNGFGAGRFDGAGQSLLRNSGASGVILSGTFADNLTTGFIGFGVYLTTNFGGLTFTVAGVDTYSGATQWAITLNVDGSITHPFGRTTNNVFPQASWMFLEVGWVNAKSGGSLIVKINEVVVINATGNTAPNTTNLWTNCIVLSGGANVALDDFYVNDSTASPGTYPCNTFNGDRRIYLLTPNAAGTATGWTPSNGSDPNYQMVESADGDTTYNSASTASAEDLFHMSALPDTVQNVLAVQVTGSYRKTDATSHTLTQRIKSGSVDQAGVGFLAPYALTTSYVFYSDVFSVDPNTGTTWTLAALASGTIQVGYRLET